MFVTMVNSVDDAGGRSRFAPILAVPTWIGWRYIWHEISGDGDCRRSRDLAINPCRCVDSPSAAKTDYLAPAFALGAPGGEKQSARCADAFARKACTLMPSRGAAP